MISKKWKPLYQKKQNSCYAYQDIDIHKDWILSQIKYWHMENYRYVIPNNNLKDSEVNLPGYKDGLKIFVNDVKFTVNNKESTVNEFGIAMNNKMCKNIKYDIVEVKSNGNVY